MEGPPVIDRTPGISTNAFMSDRLRSEGYTLDQIKGVAIALNNGGYAGFTRSREFADDIYYPTTGITMKGKGLLARLREQK